MSCASSIRLFFLFLIIVFTGCKQPVVMVNADYKALLDKSYKSIRKHLANGEQIPLTAVGYPDIEKMGVTSPKHVQLRNVYWRRDLSAADFKVRGDPYVIGFCDASGPQSGDNRTVYLLFSNGITPDFAPSNQNIDDMIELLNRKTAFYSAAPEIE